MKVRTKSQRPAWFPWAAGALGVLVLFGFLGIIEGGLRLAGAGWNTDPLLTLPTRPDLLIQNPDFHRKYYPSFSQAPEDPSRPLLTTVKKAQGVLRGFVLGDSTAQGFPFAQNQSWVRLAQEAVNRAAGQPRLELINLAKTAMTSYFVRDAAPKLLAYEPDFLVVYVGHNEVYGNLGAASGSNQLLKLLGLALREWRLGQLLSELPAPAAAAGDQTLMARQFAQTRWPADVEADRELGRILVDNLRAALSPYFDRKIPVIVFTPVGNLYSFPPFGPTVSPEEAAVLTDWQQAVPSGDGQVLSQIVTRAQSVAREQEALFPAAAAYLAGFAGEAQSPEWFIRARDWDTIPFRSRSAWSQALEAAFPENLVKTETELLARYGPAALGNGFFLDHVHPNWQGQQAFAALLARVLVDRLNLELSRPALAALFQQTETLRSLTAFSDLSLLISYGLLTPLYQQAPFSLMPLPYRPQAEPLLDRNPLRLDPEFQEVFETEAPETWLESVLARFQERGEVQAIYQELLSQAYQNPARPEAQENLATFLSLMPETAEAAVAPFGLAWELRGRPDEMKMAFRERLTALGREDLAAKLTP